MLYHVGGPIENIYVHIRGTTSNRCAFTYNISELIIVSLPVFAGNLVNIKAANNDFHVVYNLHYKFKNMINMFIYIQICMYLYIYTYIYVHKDVNISAYIFIHIIIVEELSQRTKTGRKQSNSTVFSMKN